MQEKKQLFKSLLGRVPIVGKKIVPDSSSAFSQLLEERKAQSVRNGNSLTVVVFNKNEFPSETKPLAGYFLRRFFFITAGICIGQGVIFYWLDKEFSLLIEATADESERLLAQIMKELEKEDIRLGYTCTCLL